MGYFSNGTEGLDYQERYCWQCAHWNDDTGCPVWLLHELHVGEAEWQPALDRLIPIKDKVFNGECATFWKREHVGGREPSMTPGQLKGLKEWRATRP